MTELLLLKLLLASDETTVLSAFQNHQISGLREARSEITAGLTGARPSETKKATLISHWEQYPLDSFEDVRRWKEATLLRVDASPASLDQDDQRHHELHGSSEHNLSLDQSQLVDDTVMTVSTVDQPYVAPSFREEQSGIIEDNSISWDENMPTSHLSRTPAEALIEEARPAAQENAHTRGFQSNPDFDLPEDFRKQFLW